MRKIIMFLNLMILQPLLVKTSCYTMISPSQSIQEIPSIVIQYDSETKSGYFIDFSKPLAWYDTSPPATMRRAATFIQEAIEKMTGKKVQIQCSNDISKGIVLLIVSNAPDQIKNNPEVKKALQNNGADSYNDREAYFIKSEDKRVLIIANRPEGIIVGAVDLMESTGYEILGMGPNWIYVPDYRTKALTFNVTKSGRPGFYIRALWPTSGQSYGVGTIFGEKPPHPDDETVDISWYRWAIGTKIYGSSMPGFPGHALQAYHKDVIEEIRKTKKTEGFLVPEIKLGLSSERPAAGTENQGVLWINIDADGTPEAKKVYISNGKTWVQQDLSQIDANLDLSVEFVRQIIFENMKKQSEQHFEKNPDDVFIFGYEPEDGGGYAVLDKYLRYKNWYPEYCKKEGIEFGKPYVLHNYNGLNQPVEIWDPSSASDTVFGFANWLLHEYDRWIDSLPPEKRVTQTGKPKKQMVRCSGYSYNYHDVPPDFNLDPRIRVMIASYPKHRGWDKWKNFKSQIDMAKAFQIMLPGEPSGDYRIISLAYYADPGTAGIPAGWSALPKSILEDLKNTYQAGIKALSCETDFNFGKYGLAYYLMTKILWNPQMSINELEKIRDNWFQKAFGSAWKEMKQYYDFMLVDNLPVNGPNSWAKAIRFIDEAAKKINAEKEPMAQKRIDDVKQYWYYHYLEESGNAKPDSPQMQEFVWKGQMSYMVAMHAVVRRVFNLYDVRKAAGEYSKGPAHYTHQETQIWWNKVLEFWKYVPVTYFRDTFLSNGKKASEIDLNDLVSVKEFQEEFKSPCNYYSTTPVDVPFLYNSGYMKPVKFLTVAMNPGDAIGFKLFWPYNPDDGYYRQKDVSYGVEYWDKKNKKWVSIVDETMTKQPSKEAVLYDGGKIQIVDVSIKAPYTGSYRFSVGYGGNLACLTSCTFDIQTGKYTRYQPHTYFLNQDGLTQQPVYFYIPKGTKTLDFEVYDTYKYKILTLYTGIFPDDPSKIRKIDISKQGTYTIQLNPGEDRTIARIEGNGFAFPFFYSIPQYWAKSPSALLIPRGIAEADGLTVIEK
ncbi:MAG: hypothetical protein NC825_02525 [Candidatus Omnitrophica bacterium]|nr:hypothetical protein [Candidatus Omnitrophota bacterium]